MLFLLPVSFIHPLCCPSFCHLSARWPPAFLAALSSCTDSLCPPQGSDLKPFPLRPPPCSWFQCHFYAKDAQIPFLDLHLKSFTSHLKSSSHLGTSYWVFHLHTIHQNLNSSSSILCPTLHPDPSGIILSVTRTQKLQVTLHSSPFLTLTEGVSESFSFSIASSPHSPEMSMGL